MLLVGTFSICRPNSVPSTVNLCDDSDSAGVIVEGLAGLVYGKAGIPELRVAQITRRDDIEDLAKRMAARLDP